MGLGNPIFNLLVTVEDQFMVSELLLPSSEGRIDKHRNVPWGPLKKIVFLEKINW